MSERSILAGRTVLVLEDEPIIGFELEDMLAEEGAEPIFCGSLAVARARLDQGRPDCAILDVNVHGEQSYPLAGEIAARGIPFIFATGYGASLHPPEFVAVPTVSKPYRLSEVIKAFAALEG